jgi:hypothetical protein
MTGLAIDLGTYASERRTLQNTADSIALAGGQGLPDSGDAATIADDYAARYGLNSGEVSISVSGGTTNPRVRVTVERTHRFAFLGLFGVNEKDVSASAAAGKFSAGAGTGIVPWSVLDELVVNATSGDLVTIKYDASSNPGMGNFGPIRIDGNGSSDYEAAASYGSGTVICAEGTAGCTTTACPGAFPTTCAENAPECDGEQCPPKTGNMTGPTKRAVDLRMNNTSAACDTFAETFTAGTDGKYTLDAECNPWSGGACAPAPSTAPCSRRVFLIPIIDEFGNGSSDPVTILGFALVYLEGYTGSCTGNSCDVRARFVRADVTTNAFAGPFDEDALAQFVRLVE